jgi:hypothetical protein
MPVPDGGSLTVYYDGLSITLDPHALDEAQASFGALVLCSYVNEDGEFTYQSDGVLWFSYQAFDRFVMDLTAMGERQAPIAKLSDKHSYFILSLEEAEQKVTLSVSIISEFLMYDAGLQHASFQVNMQRDIGLVTIFKESFRDFPKWW